MEPVTLQGRHQNCVVDNENLFLVKPKQQGCWKDIVIRNPRTDLSKRLTYVDSNSVYSLEVRAVACPASIVPDIPNTTSTLFPLSSC